MKIGCPSDWYTTFRDSYLSTISNKLSLNTCNFTCCYSPRSQLYPPSKVCKILQHSNNSVPHGDLSYARSRGIMKYLWRIQMQGQSWSPHFSVFHMSGPESWLVIQPCQCLEFFRCVWSNSRYNGLNQHPILASIAFLDTTDTIGELGAWRIHQIWCTWRFLNHNKELPSTIEIWTADMSSGLFPGTPPIVSSSAECCFIQAHLEPHPPRLRVTLFPDYAVILLHFILY